MSATKIRSLGRGGAAAEADEAGRGCHIPQKDFPALIIALGGAGAGIAAIIFTAFLINAVRNVRGGSRQPGSARPRRDTARFRKPGAVGALALQRLFGNPRCLEIPVAALAGGACCCLANRCEANGLFTPVDGTNGPFASTT